MNICVKESITSTFMENQLITILKIILKNLILVIANNELEVKTLPLPNRFLKH